MRFAILALSLAACGADPIVGRWTDCTHTATFHDDGRADLPVNSIETSCLDAADVIAACSRTQRWSRSGSTYRLRVAAITRPPRAGSSFDPPGPCTCGHETVDVTLSGDALLVPSTGERLHRAR
jgi:hypothetical protein